MQQMTCTVRSSSITRICSCQILGSFTIFFTAVLATCETHWWLAHYAYGLAGRFQILVYIKHISQRSRAAYTLGSVFDGDTDKMHAG